MYFLKVFVNHEYFGIKNTNFMVSGITVTICDALNQCVPTAIIPIYQA